MNHSFSSWCLSAIGLAVAAWSLTACSDDDGKRDTLPSRDPAVVLSAGTAGETELGFEIATERAERCAWVCLAEGTPVPDAGSVLDTGHAVEDDGPVYRVTASSLAPDTRYVILAAVEGDGKQVLSAPLEMHTEKSSAPAFSITGSWKMDTGVWLLEAPEPDPEWDENNYAWGMLDGIYTKVPIREWCRMYMEEYNASEAGQANPITLDDVTFTEYDKDNNEHYIHFNEDGTYMMSIYAYIYGPDWDPAWAEWLSGTYTYDAGTGELVLSDDSDLGTRLKPGRVEKLNETELVFYIGSFPHYNTYALPIGSENYWTFYATSRFTCSAFGQ